MVSPPHNGLPVALFARLRRAIDLADQLPALEQRVATLEAAQHPTKLVEWIDVAERLQRYLSRISAVEQRMKAREGSTEDADPVTNAVLRMKFPPKQNGG